MNEKNFSFPQIDMAKTGNLIYTICVEHNVSVRQLENMLNISNQSIYNWFLGKSLPSIDHLLALSRLFDVPMNCLLVYKE